MFSWLIPKARKLDVSVIVPIHNKENYVAECLESILNQENVNFEIICIDDGSVDRSDSIVKSYMQRDSRISIICNKRNLGAGPARNSGIRVAQGKYIQFTDADDRLNPKALRCLLEASYSSGAKVVRGGVQLLKKNGIETVEGQVYAKPKFGNLNMLPEIWIPWFHTCYLYDRKHLIDSSLWYPNLLRGEDPVFLARVFKSVDVIGLIPEIIYSYRVGEPRSLPNLQLVRDYIQHLVMVREIYGSEHSDCWDCYKDFIYSDVLALINKADITVEERQYCIKQLSDDGIYQLSYQSGKRIE